MVLALRPPCRDSCPRAWPEPAPPHSSCLPVLPPQALLKMDCQGLVVRLIQDFVLLTTAVEVAQRWRELAEKLAKVSKQQMDAYESPHRDRNGVVDSEVSGSKSHPSRGSWQRRGGSAVKQDVEWPPQGCRPLLILILSDLRSDGTERFVRSSGRGSAHMGQ